MEENLPKISVVMAAYNAETTIKNSVESVLSQTFSDFEFLIVDDSSTDNTYSILQEYSAKDNRIRLFRNEINQERCFSRNRGIYEARGKYIAMLDNDDIISPHRLKLQYSAMEQDQELTLCGGNAEYLGQYTFSPPQENEHIRIASAFYCVIHQSTMMMNKNKVNGIFQSTEWYRNSALMAEDYDISLRLVTSGKAKFHVVPEVITFVSRSQYQNEHSDQYITKQDAICWELQQNLLSALGILKEQQSCFAHRILGRGLGAVKSMEEYNAVLSWANTLIIANTAQHIFQTEMFNEYVTQLWHNFTARTAQQCLQQCF